MIYFISKILLSAILIALISEISKHSSLIGAIFASFPLVSILAMLWLYIDTKNSQAVAALSYDIFWLVLPSLSLFISLPILLRFKLNFYISLIGSLLIMVICYFIMVFLLRKFSIQS